MNCYVLIANLPASKQIGIIGTNNSFNISKEIHANRTLPTGIY